MKVLEPSGCKISLGNSYSYLFTSRIISGEAPDRSVHGESTELGLTGLERGNLLGNASGVSNKALVLYGVSGGAS